MNKELLTMNFDQLIEWQNDRQHLLYCNYNICPQCNKIIDKWKLLE